MEAPRSPFAARGAAGSEPPPGRLTVVVPVASPLRAQLSDEADRWC